uniref:Uncharacterized protein n=1 Tax=Amphora coffeiformis TaxID=265554 RepID=A0A7S3P4B5_9STRA|mmetsp:Transcript_19346/g.39266  ORF Transcript_19346/g.39266 Transcript_19346/m.39266 type:complete len:732 (-) Transcript_19346:135-2330(-)|eukprot:scaffold14530_cov217-Amphora_coffeaeformis.AAC.4
MVPRTSSLQGQVVTYHGGDDGSMSSYTEIDEIITVSSYETIEKPRRQGRSSATNDGNEHNNQDVADDDDDEASYETITVVLSESEYETEREEIIVSDYVTDSEYEDHEEEAPVPRPLSPKKGASPTAKRAKSPSTKKKQSKTTQPTSNLVKAKTTGTDSPKRKKNGSPKKTSSPKKGFPLVGASKRRAKPMNRDDNGDDDTPKEKDDDDDDDNEQDPNDADDEDSDEEALSDKDIKGNHSHVASDTEDDDDDDDDDPSKPKPIRVKAAVAPDSPPPSPTNNEKPVVRIPWKPNDFYRNSMDMTCFDAWKQYVPAERVQQRVEQEAQRRRTKRIERKEYITRRVKIKERRVERIRQPKKTKTMALSRALAPLISPPETIRIRRTRQIITKKRIKKEKPRKKPLLPPPPLYNEEDGLVSVPKAVEETQGPQPTVDIDARTPLSLKEKMELFSKNKTPLRVQSPYQSPPKMKVALVVADTDEKDVALPSLLPLWTSTTPEMSTPVEPLSDIALQKVAPSSPLPSSPLKETTKTPTVFPRKMKQKVSAELAKAPKVKAPASPKNQIIKPKLAPPVADETFDVAATSEVYVALTCQDCHESPTPEEFAKLAAVTRIFFTRVLRKKYSSTFEDVYVAVKKTAFECGIPSTAYNVYVEWDVQARFRKDGFPTQTDKPDSKIVPANYDFLRTLVNSLCMEFLTEHIGALKYTPFAKAQGIFMEQVVKYNNNDFFHEIEP